MQQRRDGVLGIACTGEGCGKPGYIAIDAFMGWVAELLEPSLIGH